MVTIYQNVILSLLSCESVCVLILASKKTRDKKENITECYPSLWWNAKLASLTLKNYDRPSTLSQLRRDEIFKPGLLRFKLGLVT